MSREIALGGTKLRLKTSRRLRPGRYTLTLRHDGHVVNRTSIRIRWRRAE